VASLEGLEENKLFKTGSVAHLVAKIPYKRAHTGPKCQKVEGHQKGSKQSKIKAINNNNI